MQPQQKRAARGREIGRRGRTPGQPAPATSAAVGALIAGKKPPRSRERVEVWAERLKVWLAVGLAIIFAEVTSWPTHAWARI
jgi:hypothetical protein